MLREDQPKDWYWLEDPLHKCELDALAAAGRLDRYICVESPGPWGFLNAVNELFRRSGISTDDIEMAGGKAEWFDRVAISTGQDLANSVRPSEG